jgi:hypothetical protein
MRITTIGLDIAKNVFQVHGIDAAKKVVVRKQFRRGQMMKFFEALPPCLIGMEACATAHYWARELMRLGHEVRLMPAKDVKAYVKRHKNDAADAEAICEAVRRPTMRFVRFKSAEQQGQLMQRARAFGWDRSADHIRASSQNGCIQRPDTWLHPNASRKRQILLLHRGRRPYMALGVFHCGAQDFDAIGCAADIDQPPTPIASEAYDLGCVKTPNVRKRKE